MRAILAGVNRVDKRLVLGIGLAVIASAIIASIVVVVGQEEGGEPPIGPSKALRPSEITKIPPGTPAVGLTEPLDYGPFRILPAGGPVPPPARPFVPPASPRTG